MNAWLVRCVFGGHCLSCCHVSYCHGHGIDGLKVELHSAMSYVCILASEDSVTRTGLVQVKSTGLFSVNSIHVGTVEHLHPPINMFATCLGRKAQSCHHTETHSLSLRYSNKAHSFHSGFADTNRLQLPPTKWTWTVMPRWRWDCSWNLVSQQVLS